MKYIVKCLFQRRIIMNKKKLLLVSLIIVSMATLTGCQENYKVKVYRGAIKTSSDIYYNENYTMESYEWNGTDLTIHFKEK